MPELVVTPSTTFRERHGKAMESVQKHFDQINPLRRFPKATQYEIRWVNREVSNWKNITVFGSLIYPTLYQKQNIHRDIHHFLRQVFQKCPRLLRTDAQAKRIFFEEVKDGESPHCHFIMEVPNGMSPEDFSSLCAKTWKGIALRERRHKAEMKRLKSGYCRYRAGEPRTVCIKQGERHALKYPNNERSKHDTYCGRDALADIQIVHPQEKGIVTKYCLKWHGKSPDTDFSSDLMPSDGFQWKVRGHSTETVLLL